MDPISREIYAELDALDAADEYRHLWLNGLARPQRTLVRATLAAKHLVESLRTARDSSACDRRSAEAAYETLIGRCMLHLTDPDLEMLNECIEIVELAAYTGDDLPY